MAVITLGQVHDKIMRLGSFGGCLNLLITGLWTTVADIVPQRAGKQDGLLGHAPNLGEQAVLADLPDIHPIHQHPPGRDIVKARDEVDQA